ncbi:MAG: hypothetical protein JNK85_21275 [Verrucomicrobiales bacterium]|nr:hypothetical protein [Verrucomicrobiales bacterium]
MTSRLTYSVAIAISMLLPGIPAVPAQNPTPWINEIHYDNAGTDVAEFVEIAVPTGFAESAAVRLTLYNGGDGRPYGSAHLLETFQRGQSSDGYTIYWKLISGIQNGAPDGMSLDVDGGTVDFISYEGSFAASAGPAAGFSSRELGVFELDTQPAGGSLGRTGTGATADDFLWQAMAESSPGQWNAGQWVVPEPGVRVLAGVGGMALWISRKRRAVAAAGRT